MKKRSMASQDWILAMMAASEGDQWTPVQIQKALFLVSENVPGAKEGRPFNFIPHHYGPFDVKIFMSIEEMEKEGLAYISRGFPLRKYGLPRKGGERGRQLLENMDEKSADYIRKVSDFVHRLSFIELLRSIYKHYPEMAVNSVFRNR